jgi:predicted dehydrogenase
MNVAIIGCGYWGPNLVRNFAAMEGVRVVGVCDLIPDRLDFLRRSYPAIDLFTPDSREIVRSPAIDAVVICTPVSTHFDLARQALQNGKHVLVEKPFTANAVEAEELIALAEQRNLRLMVDHTFVYTGAVQTIKRAIEAGEIGDLYYFDSVRVNLGLFQHDVNVVWDLAPHDVSIMDFLLDEQPRAVSATGTDHLDNGMENMAYITALFGENLLGHIHVNWLAPVKVRKTLLSGSKKMIIYDDMEPSEKVKVYDRGVDLVRSRDEIYDMRVQYRTGDMYAPKVDLTEALARVTAEFCSAVNEGRKPLTDGEAGLRVVRVLEAATKSMRRFGAVEELT